MPISKISITAPDAVTSTAMDSALAAAGVSHGAAKVVRDSSGKVTEVIIHLPTSAAAAATAAIEATPGLSATATEIADGEQGLDGTLESLAALEAAGFIRANGGDPATITSDGDIMGYRTAGQSLSLSTWEGNAKAPSSPLDIIIEMKVRFPQGSTVLTGVQMQNESRASLNLFVTDNGLLQANGTQWPLTDMTNFHIFRAEFSGTTRATSFYRDGVLFYTDNPQPQFPSRTNYIRVHMSATPTVYADFDYIKWTKRP